MKIGVISDLHFGHKNSQIDLFKQVIEQLQRNYSVDTIVDCGDIVDHNYITAVEAEKLREVFSDLSVDYHIVRGNHDTLSNVSVSSLLSLNNKIHIHNDIEIQQDMLFVPYVNSVTELYNKLKKLNIESAKELAFSHLNITSNIYSMLPFEKTQNLFLYADLWCNGHIHTPEKYNSLYGDFYNVGSVSSLTYGDEHFPCFSIIDVDNNYNISTHNIQGSLIHKTIDVFSVADCQEKVQDFYDQNRNYNVAWRVKLPNNFSISDKEQIKNILLGFYNTKEIQFTYLPQIVQNKKVVSENLVQHNNIPMIQQLISQYESANNVNLNAILKKELIE